MITDQCSTGWERFGRVTSTTVFAMVSSSQDLLELEFTFPIDHYYYYGKYMTKGTYTLILGAYLVTYKNAKKIRKIGITIVEIHTTPNS